ncbi:ribosome maturation factor RimM [Weissella diestrammenae]|uniref:Ribosome maturation factor RimM n=1 Tax=Weissella diestrammenae TaxID=1162633 RepID=A0A7G9T551_9LACO|nr:ribosome maturation factor RimM [Weissella diestrammenae]MCM0583082.1 ribosome maturation factor RimM [Weissella diestrammenae]QNN75226.1 ribosome maturation factor RimM [Weissella diestrammenae]
MARYKVGDIVNTHGIKGEVRVIATTDFPESRFVKGQVLFIDTTPAVKVEIATVRKHKQFILLSFVDYQNINLIEKFKGTSLSIDGEDLQELADDEYFYHEIVGLSVKDNDSGQTLGKVKEILQLPANDVWVIQREDDKDLLLPFIEQVVTEIDLNQGVAYVNVLEEWQVDEN